MILFDIPAVPYAQGVVCGGENEFGQMILADVAAAPYSCCLIGLFQDKRGLMILPDVSSGPYPRLGGRRQSEKAEDQAQKRFHGGHHEEKKLCT